MSCWSFTLISTFDMMREDNFCIQMAQFAFRDVGSLTILPRNTESEGEETAEDLHGDP